MRALPPFPNREDVLTTTQPRNRFTVVIEKWFQALVDSVKARVACVSVVDLPAHQSSVPFTVFPTVEPLAPGLYRCNVTVFPYQGVNIPSVVLMVVIIEWTTQTSGAQYEICRREFSHGLVPVSGFALMQLDRGSVVRYEVTYQPGTDTPRYAAHINMALERIA